MDVGLTREELAPRLGFRVSWGALMAGTVAMLAAITVLWLLGLGITLLAMAPEDWRGGLIALAIILVAVTLLGCAFGGLITGWLSGSRVKRYGGMHGLLASGLAFLVSTFFLMVLFGAGLRAIGSTVATTAQTTVAATAEAAGGAAASGQSVASSAERFLQGLGYSAAESQEMVREGQRSLQSAIRGKDAPTGAAVTRGARDTLNSLLNWFGGSVWAYVGTWMLAMLLALLFGAVGAARIREGEPEARKVREPLPATGPGLTTPPPLQPTGF